MTPAHGKHGETASTSSINNPERDPAASMSLLTQLLRNPLDAGYHAYADDPVKTTPRWWTRTLTLLLAIALGLASTIAVRTLRAPGADDVQQTLIEQARMRQSTIEELSTEVSGLGSQIKATTNLVPSANTPLDPAISTAISSTEVSGPGLVITLEDAPARTLETGGVGGVVRDQDLRMVINALWGAGAEAITVNGMRIGPGTFVRTAGSTILVNVTAVQSPYVVQAIGDSSSLSVALVRGGTGDYLSTAQSVQGIRVSSRSQTKLTMPALDQRITRYAEPTL